MSKNIPAEFSCFLRNWRLATTSTEMGFQAGPTPMAEQHTEPVGLAAGAEAFIQWVAQLSQMGYLVRLMGTVSAVDAKLKV